MNRYFHTHIITQSPPPAWGSISNLRFIYDKNSAKRKMNRRQIRAMRRYLKSIKEMDFERE